MGLSHLVSVPPARSPELDSTREPRRLLFLLMVTVLVVATGMAFTIWWPTVRYGTSFFWLYPGDIWGTVRVAHWIGWGDLSFVYSSRTSLVTLPGFAIFLTPAVMLGSALHLTETAPGFLPVPKPTEWLLVGPIVMASSIVPIFGFDALARTLGVSLSRRRLLSLAEAAALWSTIVIWGHPEDVVAMGLLAFALDRVLRGKRVAAGWLLGGAILMQLYAIAIVPIFIGIVGWRKAPALIARTAMLPGVVLLALAIPNPHATLHAFLDQPNFPKVDFPTPWAHLAPSLGQGTIAAGPGRLVGLTLAAALGFVAARRRFDFTCLAWLVGVALCLRCLTESVMDPYYVGAGIGFLLVAMAGRGWGRWVIAVAASAALIRFTYFRTTEWWYWLDMAAPMLVLCLSTWPAGLSVRRRRTTLSRSDSLELDELARRSRLVLVAQETESHSLV